jgi:hypothetical protein
MQKIYATNIDQKIYATNSNDNVIYGAYPLSGNAPESRNDEATSYLIRDLIPLDQTRFYIYFNAKKDWQKRNVDKIINKYRTLLIDYSISRYHFTLGTDCLQLPVDEFKRRVGPVAIYGTGKSEYFTEVVEQIQPQYQQLNEGSNITGKVSLVKPYYEIKKLIKLKDSEELLIAMYGDVDITDTNLVDITPVDTGSLKAFLLGNEQYKYQNAKVQQYHDEAQQILLIAELTGGVFPQIIKESPYGRRYYTGQSLQTMSSVVRSAALGNHFQYDLNAAVYAIKFFLCSHITDKKFTYTGEYIEGGAKYKDSIRKKIADYVYQPDIKVTDLQLSDIKKVITAVGFGATMNSKGYFDDNGSWQYTSIADIFTYKSKTTGKMVLAKDKYERLLQHPWLKEFMREQKEMTDILTKWYIDNKMVNKQDHNFLVDGRNAFSKNRLMAYIFQTFERGIMDKTEEFIKNEGGNVLLRVHDAIYTRKRIDMAELHLMLANTFVPGPGNYLGTKLISFSQEEAKRFEYFIYEDVEHKQFIKEQEELAKGYKSTLVYE